MFAKRGAPARRARNSFLRKFGLFCLVIDFMHSFVCKASLFVDFAALRADSPRGMTGKST
jgi:hypothetical protein